MSRPLRSDSDLEGAAVDVKYEIDMMMMAADDMRLGIWGSPATALSDWRKNMALECFLLHYRNLRAFLVPLLQAGPHPDDILASDFLQKAAWVDVGDKTRLEIDKRRLDQMLQHLSYKRHNEFKSQGNTNWHVTRMLVLMLHELDKFLTAIPDHIRPWFPDQADLAKERALMEVQVPSGLPLTTSSFAVHFTRHTLPK